VFYSRIVYKVLVHPEEMLMFHAPMAEIDIEAPPVPVLLLPQQTPGVPWKHMVPK
jgi:hypothetical protein